MVYFLKRLTQRNLSLVGLMLVVFGVIKAMPHLALGYQLGLAFCGMADGMGLPLVFALTAAGHCWGCAVAMIGLSMIAADAYGANVHRFERFVTFAKTVTVRNKA